MHRVFVYEHLTASTLNPDPADSLYLEGRAMRDAVCEDLRAAPGVEVVSSDTVSFDSLLRECDAALIIAPESGGILESLVRRVEAAGVPRLGPSSGAVRLTADKLALFRHWRAADVPTPVTILLPERPPFPPPYVFKPRFGCGSTGIVLSFSSAFNTKGQSTSVQSNVDEMVVQPFAPGTAASVVFLIGPAGTFPLPPCFQHVSPESNFRYEGGEVPIPADLSARAVALGRRAAGCVPGLHGYVGVDLVLGLDPDGSCDVAVEINPRLTTSYVGLRALAVGNLGRTILDICRGECPAPLQWKPGRVRYFPDGTIGYRAE